MKNYKCRGTPKVHPVEIEINGMSDDNLQIPTYRYTLKEGSRVNTVFTKIAPTAF